MPKLFNADHQAQVVDPALPAVLPGESHEFTDEQIKAGLTGHWTEGAPRKGLAAQKAKQRRAEQDADNDQSADAEKE